MTTREQRLTAIRYRRRYEAYGYRVLSGALRLLLSKIPWGRLTDQNYREIIQESLSEDILEREMAKFYRYLVTSHTRRSLALFQSLGSEKAYMIKAKPLFNALVARILKELIAVQAGWKIKTLVRSLADFVIDLIAEKYTTEGYTFDQTVREVSRELDKPDFYRWQVRRIVRTETTFVTNLASFEAARDADVYLEKTWITVLDKRTREHEDGDQYDHWDMDGTTLELDEYFEVPRRDGGDPDKLLFPANQLDEPDPANVINCRCLCSYRPKLVNGRVAPNPKKKPPGGKAQG